MPSSLVQVNFLCVVLDTSLQSLFDSPGHLEDAACSRAPIASDEYYKSWSDVCLYGLEPMAIKIINSFGEAERKSLAQATRGHAPVEVFHKLVHCSLMGLRNCLLVGKPPVASGFIGKLLERKMGAASVRYANELYRSYGYAGMTIAEVTWKVRHLINYEETCKMARERYGRPYDDGYHLWQEAWRQEEEEKRKKSRQEEEQRANNEEMKSADVSAGSTGEAGTAEAKGSSDSCPHAESSKKRKLEEK